jgi:hypothetical protein
MKYKNDELSHFNDCSNGIAPTFKELDEFASIIGLNHLDKINGKLFYHQKSGYIVYRDNNSHLIADVGNVGSSTSAIASFARVRSTHESKVIFSEGNCFQKLYASLLACSQ